MDKWGKNFSKEKKNEKCPTGKRWPQKTYGDGGKGARRGERQGKTVENERLEKGQKKGVGRL